ncbi:MAG: hypothetical protein NVSMB12_18690 [Acidimicrobiales bacterium]
MTGGPPEGRRQLRTLYAAGFVTAFGAHAVAANLGGYSHGHRTSLLELGILLALYDGAEVVLNPLFGALADRIGPKPVILGGLVGFGLVSGAFALAGGPATLALARCGQGAAAAAISPAAGAMVARRGGPGRRGTAFGGYGGAKGLGYLAGPLAGGAIVSAGGYPALFAALGVLAIVVAGGVAVGVQPGTPVPRSRETLAGLVRRIGDPAFLVPVAVLAAGTAALSSGVGFLPVRGAADHLGPLATGAIVSLLALTAALVQPWTGRSLDTTPIPPGRLGATGIVACAAGFAVAAVAHGPVGLCVAAVAIGCGVGVSTPIGFALLAASAPEGRMGQTMGAGEVGRELGDAGGPLLVGAVAAAGLGAGFTALAVVLAATSVAVGRPGGWTRPRVSRARPPGG